MIEVKLWAKAKFNACRFGRLNFQSGPLWLYEFHQSNPDRPKQMEVLKKGFNDKKEKGKVGGFETRVSSKLPMKEWERSQYRAFGDSYSEIHHLLSQNPKSI